MRSMSARFMPVPVLRSTASYRDCAGCAAGAVLSAAAVGARRLFRGQLCRPHQLVAHRHKLFGRRGVNADRLVELLFGGAAFDGDGKPLDDLGASGPSIWQPTTRSLRGSTISFMTVRSSRPDSVFFIGRKRAR